MSERTWYRSLYWRIALGLVAFLALMLAAQGLLFIWMTDQIAGSVPARAPRRLAVMVAPDLGAAPVRAQIERMEAFGRLRGIPRDRDDNPDRGLRGPRRRGDFATILAGGTPVGT